MEDYPKTLAELEKSFATDDACREYLAELRWQGEFACPRCGSDKGWRMNNGLMLCGSCRHQASVIQGTIFQDSHLPLTVWFRAMWHVCVQKNGMSALGLKRALGLGSHRTAWLALHKLRKAMVRPGRERLSGVIEVDETSETAGCVKSRRGVKLAKEKITFDEKSIRLILLCMLF
jgi:hypothetical protein